MFSGIPNGLPQGIPQPLLLEVAHVVSGVRQQPKAWFAPDDTRIDDLVTGLVVYHQDCERLTAEEKANPEAMSEPQFRQMLVWACELDDRLADGVHAGDFTETELNFLLRAGLVHAEDIRE